MCGRYQMGTTDGLTKRFGLDTQPPSYKLSTNIYPGQFNPVVVSDQQKHIRLMKWGLLPSWAQEEKTGYSMINARYESIDQKKSYRDLIATNRCLIPATGFYEWTQTADGKKPYLFTPKDDTFIAFAGLYSTWKGSNGTLLDTYTIITTSPSRSVAPIHDRMPLILTREQEEAWLNPDITEVSQLHSLIDGNSDPQLVVTPVQMG